MVVETVTVVDTIPIANPNAGNLFYCNIAKITIPFGVVIFL